MNTIQLQHVVSSDHIVDGSKMGIVQNQTFEGIAFAGSEVRERVRRPVREPFANGCANQAIYSDMVAQDTLLSAAR
jgi:hypothetical protein